MADGAPRVVLLAGGVGGARMACGLAQRLPPDRLTVIVNVGDDECFHGLTVCPDLDTVTYTLAGLVHPTQGWGLAGDSAVALGMLRRLGAAGSWMQLGDADIGLHLYRSEQLARGETLTDVTRSITQRLGVACTVLPASDQPAPTLIDTDEGRLRFQQWFVERRAAVPVRGVCLEATASACMAPAAQAALRAAELVVIAPSNPLLSIQPMLALPGFSLALRSTRAPRIAVSPLIGGRALKGPLDRMLADLGRPGGNAGIAMLYQGLIDMLVIDEEDGHEGASISQQGALAVAVEAIRIGEAEAAAALASRLLQRAQAMRDHLTRRVLG